MALGETSKVQEYDMGQPDEAEEAPRTEGPSEGPGKNQVRPFEGVDELKTISEDQLIALRTDLVKKISKLVAQAKDAEATVKTCEEVGDEKGAFSAKIAAVDFRKQAAALDKQLKEVDRLLDPFEFERMQKEGVETQSPKIKRNPEEDLPASLEGLSIEELQESRKSLSDRMNVQGIAVRVFGQQAESAQNKEDRKAAISSSQQALDEQARLGDDNERVRTELKKRGVKLPKGE